MRIASIVDNDGINSLTGFTLTFYCVGCSFACKDCYNKSLWDINGGKEFSIDELKLFINNTKCTNVSFLGGENFMPHHREQAIELMKYAKEKNKTIYVWTGYSKEEVEQWIDISMIDFLITDRFEVDKRDLKLLLRGSTNQRIFCNGVQKTDKEILEMLND